MSVPKEPIHPGEVVKDLYRDPLDMGAIAFVRRLGVPRTRIVRLIKGTTRITPDTALRLARISNTTPAYWVNLQTNYDLAVAAKEIDVSNIELDLSRFSAAPSARLSHLAFESDRAFPTQC